MCAWLSPPVGWLCRPAPKLALQQGCPVDSAYAPRYRHSTECSWTGEPGWPVWSTCCGCCTPTPWCSSMTFFPEATTITLSGTTTLWCLPDFWAVLFLLLHCDARQPLLQDVPLMANQQCAAAQVLVAAAAAAAAAQPTCHCTWHCSSSCKGEGRLPHIVRPPNPGSVCSLLNDCGDLPT